MSRVTPSSGDGKKRLKDKNKHKSAVKDFERQSGVQQKHTINKAMQWYFNRVRLASGHEITAQNSYATVDDVMGGGLFQYTYDPKYADTLPYYDKFPLVIPIEMTHNGWLGLNLHYLPPRVRAIIFDDIINIGAKKKNKLIVAYAWVKNYSKHSIIRHAIKRYLYTHITSPVVLIKEDEWDNAVLLPTQTFMKKSDVHVWGDWKD